jgi:transposase InsO family protein
LLLQPHVGQRPVRAHEGSVIALASNQRWSSDVLEISCWNGEVVRIAFTIDTCDREIIAWQASTGGISGEMIRDLMLGCVERRFASLRAPHPVQWLADNGSAYTARETLDFAAALSLIPCFTPGAKPGEQWRQRGVREDLEARLRADQASPGRPDRAAAATRLDR